MDASEYASQATGDFGELLPAGLTCVVRGLPKESNRCFVVHEVSLFCREVPVGYIKIEFSPRKLWDKTLPTIMHFAAELEGYCGLREAIGERDVCEQVRILDGYLNFYSFNNAIPSPTVEQCNAALPELLATLKWKMQARYEGFRTWWRGCGNVAYVSVEKDFQGLGISRLLYLLAARHSASLGIRFFASTVQTESANGAWVSMTKRGWVSTTSKFSKDAKQRRFIKKTIFADDSLVARVADDVLAAIYKATLLVV